MHATTLSFKYLRPAGHRCPSGEVLLASGLWILLVGLVHSPQLRALPPPGLYPEPRPPRFKCIA